MIKENKRGTRYVETEGVIIEKECTKCKRMLKLTDYDKATKRFAGVAPSCKKCNKGYFLNYYKENKEKILEQSRKYYSENRESVISRTSNYHKIHPEVNKKAWKKWSRQNKNKIAEYKRRWRIENIEDCKVRESKWRLNNKNKVVLKSQKRRALKKKLPNNFTHEQHESLLKYFDYKCPLTGSENIHIDHFVPLAIGHGGTTVNNMVPLDATLNTNKQAQNPFEWFRQAKELYDITQQDFDNIINYLSALNDMTPFEYREYVYWCFANPRELDLETEESQCH